MKANEQIPMCCNCKRGRSIPLTDDVVCPLKGVVASNYSCKKYEYNLFLIKSKRKRKINLDEFAYSDFSITD
jgi:hypothetical protein